MAKFALEKIRDGRLSKIDTLREMGLNPFPSRAGRTHYADTVLAGFEELAGTSVTIAGRLMSWRPHGRLAFGHVQDQSGRIQILVNDGGLEDTNPAEGVLGYGDLKLVDIGDIVEVTGKVDRTKRGEITIFASRVRLLSKSLRPLPEKWSGLQDREAILRRRYLDTTMEPDHKTPFSQVAKMVYAIRQFLAGRGFIEFNTPIIQPQYGGGTAKPFITHVNTLNTRMYLAISHELYLKRLIAAGFDKVFTIGRYFRNEGIDRTHHPEFSMVETMTAYENYEYNMDLVEDMFRHVAQDVFGKTVFKVRENEVDFGKPWARVSVLDAVREKTGADFAGCESLDAANALLAGLGINEAQASVGAAIIKAFEDLVVPSLVQPTIVYGHPMDISPLAKPMAENPAFAERFEIIIAGMECGDNWSEQNDPVYLYERWRSAYQAADAGSDEYHPLDHDFVEMLEYGLPPTTGIGPGIERMAMIFTEQDNIDDVIFFPMMRPVISPLNAAIYEVDKLPAYAKDSAEVALSAEDFQELLSDNILSPLASGVTIRPYLKRWAGQAGPESSAHRATGYIEVEGIQADGVVIVSGYTVRSDTAFDVEEEKNRLAGMVQAKLVAAIKKLHPDCGITVENVAEVG